MISLLAKLFLKTDGKSESDLRKAYGILCGAVGIGLNILLFLLKFFHVWIFLVWRHFFYIELYYFFYRIQ